MVQHKRWSRNVEFACFLKTVLLSLSCVCFCVPMPQLKLNALFLKLIWARASLKTTLIHANFTYANVVACTASFRDFRVILITMGNRDSVEMYNWQQSTAKSYSLDSKLFKPNIAERIRAIALLINMSLFHNKCHLFRKWDRRVVFYWRTYLTMNGTVHIDLRQRWNGKT